MSTSANKTATTLTNLAGNTVATSGGTGTSQWVNVSTKLETEVVGKITWSGSTTAAPTVQIQISPDNGTTVFTCYTFTGPIGSSPWELPEIPIGDAALYVRVIVTNNDTSVTITATFDVLTLDSLG